MYYESYINLLQTYFLPKVTYRWEELPNPALKDRANEIIYSIIERCGAIDNDVQYLQFSQIEGIVNGVLYFADGSRLEFTERIVIRSYRPFKERYRYQYLRDDETVFRYDNAPHHLYLPTFPHHKHEEYTIVASSESTLQQVLAEIASLMSWIRQKA